MLRLHLDGSLSIDGRTCLPNSASRHRLERENCGEYALGRPQAMPLLSAC